MEKQINKKITIIIPMYNVESFVLNTLNSLYSQTISFDLFEVILINDGSTDNTKNIVQNWIKTKEVSNFKYYEKINGNWGSVINYAKNNRLIKGDYVTILDADDLFLPNTLEEFLPYLNEKNELVLSGYLENRENKYKKALVLFEKTRSIKSQNCHTGWSIPLCKFYKSNIFYQMPDLKEGVSYQDQILFHSFLLKIETVFFIKKYLGIYWVERIDSSSAQAWNKNRISIWSDNMNFLLNLKSNQIAAYVMMMTWFVKKNIKKEDWVFFNIDKNNLKQYKQAKFNWLPIGTRKISKLFFWLSTKKII